MGKKFYKLLLGVIWPDQKKKYHLPTKDVSPPKKTVHSDYPTGETPSMGVGVKWLCKYALSWIS